MSSTLKHQIARITAIPHIPSIFISVLENENEEFLLAGEEILDTVFVERDGFDYLGTVLRRFDSWTPATLIVVTNYGISILREGGQKITDSLYGYSIHHTVFDKISSLEFSVGLHDGTMTISTSTSAHPDTVVNFNTAVYFKDFERLIRLIRNRVFLSAKV
jgi:hypothetical protein